MKLELIRRKVVVSDSHLMCGEYEETVDHLLLYCPIAREIWFASV